LPKIIPPFTSASDRGYKFLRVFDQLFAARGGRLVLYVEGGIAPYDWVVTGSDFVLDEAQTSVQYNFVTVNDAAVIDNVETVTVTDANGSAVTMIVCTCNPTICEDSPDAFSFVATSKADLTPYNCSKAEVTGGCGPYYWKVLAETGCGDDFDFLVEYTNAPWNLICADANSDPANVCFQVTDRIGTTLTYPCDDSTPLSFDDDSTPDTIAPSGNITLYINGSTGPFYWEVDDPEFSLAYEDQWVNGLTNALYASADACGTVTITVTDCLGEQITIEIRSTAGTWNLESSGACTLAGLPDERSDAGAVHTFYKYSGAHRQYEVAHRNGVHNTGSPCPGPGDPAYCCLQCSVQDCSHVYCTQCIDYHDSLEFPGYLVPCRETGTGGTPNRISCGHIHDLQYQIWECA
jgi:hypothetical protein